MTIEERTSYIVLWRGHLWITGILLFLLGLLIGAGIGVMLP